MIDDRLTQEEVSILSNSMMPKQMYLELRKLYEDETDEFHQQLVEALDDEEKWDKFAKEHKIDYKPLAKIEGDEIKDSCRILKFNSPEEQDAWLQEQGLLG